MASRLVAAKAKLRLKLQRWHADGMTGDDVRGKNPNSQRQMAAVHHRASRHGCLLCATAHSQVARFRFNGQPLQVPQQGHTKPSSQRCSARQCEHASSPENLASNAGRDMGVSLFHLAGIDITTPEYFRLASRAALHHVLPDQRG